MHIASILPINYLSYTKDDEYMMALSHLILKDKTYRDFYKNRPKSTILTVDNSIIEGEEVDLDELISAAEMVNADEIILPDIWQNKSETIYKAKECIKILKERQLEGRFHLMAVAQGKNLEEYEECAKELLKLPIDTLGLPKFMGYYCLSARSILARVLSNEGLLHNRVIHFLGCWSSPLEVIEAHNISEVRSCDSCLPWIYTANGYKITEIGREDLIKGIDFFTDESVSEELLQSNLRIWRDAEHPRIDTIIS